MALITQAEALVIVSLATMKTELRIPLDIHEHDELITGQITAAVSHVAQTTGQPPQGIAEQTALRSAAVLLVRELYDGAREIRPNAAFNLLMRPYRSYKPTQG